MARYVFNLDLIQGVRVLEQNTNQLLIYVGVTLAVLTACDCTDDTRRPITVFTLTTRRSPVK